MPLNYSPFATCTQQLLRKDQQMWVKTALPSHELLGLNPTAQVWPAQGLFRFWLQVRPSSLATTPIRPSCHLSGCQLIIMILMIFQLDSALNPDQGYGRFPTRPHHRGATEGRPG